MKPLANQLVAAGATAAVLMTAAPVAAQHVHGRIEVGVVVEGSVLAVSVQAPLGDIIGFEHEPRNTDQESTLSDAAKLLVDAGGMFAIPDAAGCTVKSISISGPDFVAEKLRGMASNGSNLTVATYSADQDLGHSESHGDSLEESHGHEDDHDHDDEHHDDGHDEDHHDHDHDSHAAHDDDHSDHSDHDDHDADEAEAHADVDADYTFECGNTSALTAMSLLFPRGFEAVDEVVLQIITETQTRVDEVQPQGRAVTVPLS
ncbi:MAG: DUF2796 domain-containing protein [Pseudomonadota bacterium]